MLSINECKEIYDAAVAAKDFKGSIEAAKRYLDANDTEGFERVCRGISWWLAGSGIRYMLSDGVSENWYDNGVLSTRQTYVNGKKEGLCEIWHDNGVLELRTTYVNNQVEGVYEQWYDNGVLRYRGNYKAGVLEGLQETWCRDGYPRDRNIYSKNRIVLESESGSIDSV